MTRHVRGLLVALAAVVVPMCGCEYLPFGQTAQSDLEDDEFGDLGEAPDEFSSDSEAAPTGSDASEAELALRLEVGQRFPLVKTVEQRLTQVLPSGINAGYSRLDLQLSLTVEEERSGQRRIGVRYHRVRYHQEMGGQTSDYNSDQPPNVISPEALPYAGLKDNGFSFWIGSDNRVLELVGFNDFLKRCVQNVPAEQRANVMHHLQTMRSDDGLASFVDDSIGLLPGSKTTTLRVGSSWDLPTRVMPLSSTAAIGSSCTTRCLLKDMNEKTAEISLVGSIGPSSYTDDLRKVKLTVRSGQCTGLCTVDRTTGMPTRSRVERLIDMVAQLPDGTEIPQRKEVITMITAYLEQGAVRQTASRETTDRDVMQSSYTAEQPPRLPPPVTSPR